MPLVKSIFIKGTTDFGAAKAELADVAARARKVGEISPTIGLKVDDGAALLKLKAFSMELRALKDSGSQAGLSDLAARLKTFGNEAGTSRTKMAALKLETDALTASMGGGGGRGGGLAGAAGEAESGVAGLSGPGGMGMLIGAGAALSPVVATLGVGLAGLGAAAFGVISPIEKAAGKAGGLSKNLGTLDAEQKIAATSILGLGRQYSAFEKSLQPEVLGALNAGIRLAGHLMHDVQPVAAATGKAFDGFLGQIDQTFASGEFQGFFRFMATTAAPDMRLLGTTVIDVTKDLPPLLEALQPVGRGVLVLADDIAKATGAWAGFIKTGEEAVTKGNRPGSFGTQIHDFFKYGWAGAPKATKDTKDLGTAMGGLTSKTQGATAAIKPDVTALWSQNTALLAVAGNVLTLEGDQVSWKQAQQAATKAIDANKHSLDGNSASALSARQAIIGATQSALTFATAQNHTETGVKAASRVIQDQINWLETHAAKSKIAAAEIKALRDEERKLRNIENRITVFGSGRWHVLASSNVGPGGPGHRVGARGMLVTGGTPGVDSVPILAQQGEAVVPRHLTPAIAPLMKAHGVPGFAAGGVVGSYTGGIPGLTGWLKTEEKATIHAIAADTAAALLAAMKAAVQGGGPAVSGGGGPAAALFRRMYPQWATGADWAATNYVAMKESGWNTFAVNPTSGAAGVAQRIQGWAPFYQPGNAFQQDRWFHDYMLSRYGGPIGAAIHESSQGWYDQGGWLPPGLSLALNTTGRPERVGGGNTYHITVHVPPLGRPADVGREVVSAIKAFEKGSGNSWRK